MAETEACRLVLCGAPQAVSQDGRVQPLSASDAAMLAYLAIEGPTSRQRMLALLWPDEAPDRVRQRLRQRLFTLKGKLGVEAVAGTLTLALAPTLHWPGFEQEDLERPFLGDVASFDLPGFADWLDAVRERLQAQRRERLAGSASALEQQGRLAEAIVAAEQLLALEPCQEHAHRRLMRLHYLRGDRAAALLAFDRCERVLKDEVGTTPCAETLELLAQVDLAAAPMSAAPRRVVPATVLRPPRLIGRRAEWERLQAAWTRGDAMALAGEAGMGKTRLLDELLQAHAGPAEVLRESARPGDERVPYALWSRLLRGLLARRTEPLPVGIQAELARLLPELQQPVGPWSRDHDEAARARFVGAIEATLRDAVAAGLHTVVLDDLHFADAASLELAQHLAGCLGLRWLVAYRCAEIGAPARALLDTLAGRLQGETLRLQALSAAEVASLVDSLGLNLPDAEGLAAALHQRSGGNPQFLLETLKALLLAAPGPAGHVQAVAALPAGGSITRLIERRLGQLSPQALKLARCAAIAGQDFSAALAAQVLAVDPLDLAEAWSELETAQVLRDGAFAHDLVQEAAARSVPAPITRELHRRVAERLQGLQAAPARVATHWLGAGEELRAAPCLAEAGRQALRAMRLRESIDYFDQAQAIHARAGDADAQCALLDELLEPAFLSGSGERVQHLVEQATRQATTERQRSMTLRSLCALLGWRCEHERAAAVGHQALAAAIAAQDRTCEVTARCVLAEQLVLRCQPDEAARLLQPIEPWVQASGSAPQRLALASAMGKVLYGCGQVTQALAQLEVAIELARQAGAEHTLPALLGWRAGALWLSGRGQASRDSRVEARLLLHDAPEDAPYLRLHAINLQVADRQLGHYTDSLMQGERVLADPAVGVGEIDEVQIAQAFAFCDLGQPARVRQLVLQAQAAHPLNALLWKEVAALPPQPLPPDAEACRLALEAAADAASRWSGRNLLTAWRMQARLGDDAQAVAAARRGVEFTAAGGIRGQQLVFQALLAQRLARRGEHTEALSLARDSWRLMAEFCSGMVYRGVVWQALHEVLEPHDAALARNIVRNAAEWIRHTAAERVPAAYREGFLRRNPFNAALLAAAAERQVSRLQSVCGPGRPASTT